MKEFYQKEYSVLFNTLTKSEHKQTVTRKYRNIYHNLLLLSMFLISSLCFSQKVYQESAGVVMMEAENTPSPLDLWVNSTYFPVFSGTGHIEFSGNVPDGSGTPKSPLIYKFKINTAGDYSLIIRGRSRLLSGEPTDIANDAWVRLEGDYTVGTGGPPDISWLNQDTKMFVGRGGNGDWGWASKFDINHVQPTAIYNFKAGQTYTLYMSGRSQRFNVDRILFVNTANDQTAAKAITTESSSFDDGVVVERYIYEAVNHFPEINAGVVPYYKDGTRNALAINASITADRDKFARATTTFTGKDGTYDIKLTTLAETDGECTFRILVNGVVVGTFQNPRITFANEYQLQNSVYKSIVLKKNDVISVESNTHTNGLIPEAGGTAWARGRWRSVSMTPTLYQGRIAVVADGNYRDSDDIAGTPISLAILRALGLEKKLVHYSHSCDLVPGGSDPGGDFREVEMQTSSDGTALRWGGFEHLTFFNCIKQKTVTITDLKNQINSSTETDPLWIIEAGEPDIMWEAVNQSDVGKRKYIHIVTHHPANDVGDTHNLSDVMALGVPSANLHSIPDQNTLLKKPLSEWYWARDHSDDRVKWLWDRGFKAQTTEMNYPAIVGFFDCSDAGMIYYWATLDNGSGGDQAPDVPKLKKLFEDYLLAIPAKVKFKTPKVGDLFLPGTTLDVEAELTVNAAEITSVALYNNDVLVRTISSAPYQWGAVDLALNTMLPGTYNLKLVATDTDSKTSEAFYKAMVPDYAYFVTPKSGATLATGSAIEVEAALNVAASEVTSIELFIDNVSVRTLTVAPFKWGFAGQMDAILENKTNGIYTLKLVITNKNAATTQITRSITVATPIVYGPYSGTPISIPGIVQIEDYDLGGQGLAYNDSTIGNDTSGYRLEKDVDLSAGGSGYVSTSLVGGEYTRYLINVTEAGTYKMLVNYKTSSAISKPFSASLLSTDLTTTTPLFSAPSGSTTSGIRAILVSGVAVYGDYTSPDFTLPAGNSILQLTIPSGGAGPNYDYVTVVKSGALGVGDFQKESKLLKAFPNPSSTGIFNFGEDTSWEVYSISGVKVKQGKGKLVDISNAAKGVYILKTPLQTLKIIF
jgi:hypothetical protein